MNEEVKAKWVAALRSGEYEQSAGQLRFWYGDTVKHCCLGVLSDLAVKASVVAPWDYRGGPESSDGVLGDAVLDWAQLGSSNPQLGGEGFSTTAAGFNDNGKSFSEIADLIERYL